MRVLVVEDEARMAELIRRGLVEEGHAVDLAATGVDGLWLASEQAYDVIVLDVMLPGLDGFEMCRVLRTRQRWTPILLLTARGGLQDKIDGLDAGADDYLVKPFAFGELVARLRALVRRDLPARPTVLRVGDLHLDPATRVVTRSGLRIAVTAKEFAILELLMRHPGEVLSRARIFQSAWDFASDATSNVVDQYLAYLRRKIDRPFGRHDLETVRGAGYRLRRSDPHHQPAVAPLSPAAGSIPD